MPVAYLERDRPPSYRCGQRRRVSSSHIDMRFPENVHHLLACGQKVVGDDPAVAPPPDGFGAHDRASVPTAPFPQPRQAGREGRRQGIICIVLKALHPPIGIGRGPGAA